MNKIVGIRLSEPFRTLLQSGDDMSSIARALMLIGAHTAGYDLTPLQGDVAALLCESLPTALDTALRQGFITTVLNRPFNGVLNTSLNGLFNSTPEQTSADALPLPTLAALGLDQEEDADPFGSLGIDV